VTRVQGDAQPPETSVSLDHFDGLYEAKDDPWDLATKWHDRRKYAVTVASLPREHYRRCYEPGASVGLLTRLLAARCDEVLATDAVDSAVEQARSLLADLPNVAVERALLPAEMPDGTFDLIVIGDLLYYLSAADMEATLDGLLARLDDGGDLVAVHFRDRENGGSFDGFNAHEGVGRSGLTHVLHHSDEWFLLDVWRK
jgi:trans-aconitate methyltransferase